MLLSAQTKGQLELDVVLGAAGRGLGEREREGAGAGHEMGGEKEGGRRGKTHTQSNGGEPGTERATDSSQTEERDEHPRRKNKNSQDEVRGRAEGAADRPERQGGGKTEQQPSGAAGRRMEMGWQNQRQTPAAPPQPARHLVGLLLAHGQGQLQLQLLLPAALWPRLLRLGRGPRAHRC